MKRYLTFVAGLLLAPALAAQEPRAALAARIDSVVEAEMQRTHVPGVTVAVEQRGDLIVAKGYGMADLESSVPASIETVYRIGSITKQFTALGIMQLIEQGKMSLDDEITKFLPDYPTQGHRVTIRHLLTHTSGIKSYTSLGPKFWNETSRIDQTNDQMLALFKNEPFDFNPGEKYQYNNSAFFILGVIIEKVSGLPYPKYLEERITKPLGLTSTGYCNDRAIVPHRSSGYEVDGEKVLNAAPISMTTPGAAGAICSTVLDLLAWERSFNAARLISPASRDLMRTSAKLNDGKPTNYGFGLGVGPFEGHRSVAHSGGVNGFVTWLANYPDDDLTVTVLSNSGNGPAPRIGQLIARVMLGLKLPTLVNLPADAALRSRVVGTYEAGPGKLVVREAGNGLEAKLGPAPFGPLLYQGNNEFRLKDNPDLLIQFPDGSEVVVVTPGGTIKGKKVQ
jgi:CubicO group peptidase (beta-lactamase class C family)